MKRLQVSTLLSVLGLIVCLSAGGLVAFAGKGGKPGKGGVNPAAILTISDSFLPNQQLLFSDGKKEGRYVDWRLEGQDPDPCVWGWVKQGSLFMYTNRGGEYGIDCEEYYDPQEYRWYVVKFPAASGVCAELGLAGNPCEVEARRISSTPFPKKGEETGAAFMFYYNGISYRLESSGATSGSGDTRTVTNTTGTAQLLLISSRLKPQPVGSPFTFPFQFTVERIPQ